jgi:hypothetical protein
MNQNLLRQYVETRLKTNWTYTSVKYENLDFTPVIGQAYIELSIEPERSYQIGLVQQPMFRHEGLLVFEIRVPSNTGTKNARTYIDNIAKIFAGKQFNDITCRSIDSMKIGKVGEWYLTVAYVEYYYDSIIE